MQLQELVDQQRVEVDTLRAIFASAPGANAKSPGNKGWSEVCQLPATVVLLFIASIEPSAAPDSEGKTSLTDAVRN